MEFNTRAGIRTVKDGRWRWLLQSQGYVFRSNPYVKFRKTVNKTNSYFVKKKFYLTVLRESTGITEVLCAIQVSVRIETCEFCLISASIRTEIPFLKLSENCFFLSYLRNKESCKQKPVSTHYHVPVCYGTHKMHRIPQYPDEKCNKMH